MKDVTLAVSIGCPSGVGPEVAVIAAARSRPRRRVFLVGDPGVVEHAIFTMGLRKRVILVETREDALRAKPGSIAVFGGSAELESPLLPGSPNEAAGRAQLAWIDAALSLVTGGVADALVTGPVSKHAIATSGARGASSFLGHTEHLAKKLRAREVVMAFWSREITTALVTTHLPLSEVPRAIRPKNVAMSTYWLARLLSALGARSPRIAVASLNPHAGEGGLLGREERTKIGPGVEAARERLAAEGRSARIDGPLGAETAMRKAVSCHGRVYDGVVAMYHDQATIPMKVLAFGDAVNVTLGLPIVRTSVDHGTGYDIAWSGRADAGGMIEAMELATRLARATGD